MYKNYIKIAWRNLWKNRFFSVVNISGLSVGLSCCMLILLFAKDETGFDTFFDNNANIYRITVDLAGDGAETTKLGSTGMMPGPAFKNQLPEIEQFVRIESTSLIIKNKADVFEQPALYADENIFSVFSFQKVNGNLDAALKDMHAVVLSEAMAEKYFGTTDVIGKTLEINTGKNFSLFTVTAIIKNAPQNSSLNAAVILPMKYRQSVEDDKQWMNFFLNTFIVLKPGTDSKRLEQRLSAIYKKEAAAQIKEMADKYDIKYKTEYHLQPLLQMHLSKDYPADNGLDNPSNANYTYLLVCIAAFILLIACINFVNLTIARSLKRAKEIGIRKVAGGNRKQLVIQFLGETAIVSCFAFFLAVVLTYTLLPFFNVLANKQMMFSYLLDWKLVTGYFALFIITSFLAGFYPAIILSGFKPIETLYGKLRFSAKNSLSFGLVVCQFFLSTFLIIATVTMYSQFNYLVNSDLGYDNKNVMVVNTKTLNNQNLNLLKSELLKTGAVSNITSDQGGTQFTNAHINGEVLLEFNVKYVDENYLPLFKIPVLNGRNFSPSLSSDTVESAIVNEAFVQAAGWKKPLGEMVDFFYNNKKYRVIGVVRDYHFAALNEKIKPQLFKFSPSRGYRRAYIKTNNTSRLETLSRVQKVFKSLYPEQPYQYYFEDENNMKQYDTEAKWKQIVTVASLLTIFISCIGLFGLAALSAEKRSKEIGIRKVLGASVPLMVAKLSGDFIKPVLAGALLAIPSGWWVMNKWLQNYSYRINIQPVMPLIVICFVLSIAVLTVIYQSAKAALANPVKSLRTE